MVGFTSIARRSEELDLVWHFQDLTTDFVMIWCYLALTMVVTFIISVKLGGQEPAHAADILAQWGFIALVSIVAYGWTRDPLFALAVAIFNGLAHMLAHGLIALYKRARTVG